MSDAKSVPSLVPSGYDRKAPVPAPDRSSNKAPLICPACAGPMVLTSIAPNCKGVVYGYLCSNDGGRLSWQPSNA